MYLMSEKILIPNFKPCLFVYMSKISPLLALELKVFNSHFSTLNFPFSIFNSQFKQKKESNSLFSVLLSSL